MGLTTGICTLFGERRPQRLIEEWIGREGEPRRRGVAARAQAARQAGDVGRGVVSMGETVGLIDDIAPAASLVERIVTDAEALLRQRAAALPT